jgi:hypothetical protein
MSYNSNRNNSSRYRNRYSGNRYSRNGNGNRNRNYDAGENNAPVARDSLPEIQQNLGDPEFARTFVAASDAVAPQLAPRDTTVKGFVGDVIRVANTIVSVAPGAALEATGMPRTLRDIGAMERSELQTLVAEYLPRAGQAFAVVFVGQAMYFSTNETMLAKAIMYILSTVSNNISIRNVIMNLVPSILWTVKATGLSLHIVVSLVIIYVVTQVVLLFKARAAALIASAPGAMLSLKDHATRVEILVSIGQVFRLTQAQMRNVGEQLERGYRRLSAASAPSAALVPSANISVRSTSRKPLMPGRSRTPGPGFSAVRPRLRAASPAARVTGRSPFAKGGARKARTFRRTRLPNRIDEINDENRNENVIAQEERQEEYNRLLAELENAQDPNILIPGAPRTRGYKGSRALKG